MDQVHDQSFNSTTTGLGDGNRRPTVRDHNDFHEIVGVAKDYLEAFFEGLGMDDFLLGEDACFDTVEQMLWYYYNSYYNLVEDDHWEIYNSTLNFLRGIGYTSPALRKCYKFTGENQDRWLLLEDRLLNIENLYYAVKANLIRSYSEIDRHSWGALVAFEQGNYVQCLRLANGVIYLIFI